MTGLPSLQALDRAQTTRIWLATEASDMRCGFDRMAERVRGVIGQDPLSGHYFQCPIDCTHPKPGSPLHTDYTSFPSAERKAI